MPDFTPLCITAHLQTRIIAEAFLPLDGVLLFLAMRDKYGPQDASQSGRGVHDERPQLAQIFFEHQRGTPQWFPACSFVQWHGTVTADTGYWHKRLDLQYAAVLTPPRARVVTENGRYRSYRMPVFTRHALAVSWYARADRQRLEALLRFVTHLGKKGAQGEGSLLKIEVQSCEKDYSIWGPEGQLMRAIPDSNGSLSCGFRPPYWERKNQALCRIPGVDG